MASMRNRWTYAEGRVLEASGIKRAVEGPFLEGAGVRRPLARNEGCLSGTAPPHLVKSWVPLLQAEPRASLRGCARLPCPLLVGRQPDTWIDAVTNPEQGGGLFPTRHSDDKTQKKNLMHVLYRFQNIFGIFFLIPGYLGIHTVLSFFFFLSCPYTELTA